MQEIYRAETKKSFSQRIRRLREQADKNIKNDIVLSKILTLCNKKERFIVAYDHPDTYRTSNMSDRLMRWMDKYLFNRKYSHGTFESAKLTMRAWHCHAIFSLIVRGHWVIKPSSDPQPKNLTVFVIVIISWKIYLYRLRWAVTGDK